MGLSIINNLASIGAQRAMVTANNSLTSSISRLSSGLRINSAKDDPSGLAISERFRTQIRGLARASANAQDAISFLQTAEGALNETHSILQRMRELAVQAANGVLTASDRVEIQKEVDQLAQEVDRIAKSTEFNTKKLLDGSSAGLWSADNADISAVITGTVAEGNYKLVKDAEPTVNHVIKTDIFSVKAGAQGVENLDLGATAALWTDTVAAAAGANPYTLVFNFGGSDQTVTYTGNVVAATNALNIANAINADSNVNGSVVASVSGTTLTITAKTVGTAANTWTFAEGTSVDLTTATTTPIVPTTLAIDSDSGITSVNNPQNLPAGIDYTVTVNENAAVAADAATLVREYSQAGSTAAWSTLGAGAGAEAYAIATDASGYLIVEVSATDNAGIDTIANSDFRVSIDGGQNWYNVAGSDIGDGVAAFIIDGTSFTLDLDSTANVQVGDKALFGYYGNGTATNETIQVTVPDNAAGPLVSYDEADLVNTTTTVDVASMDENGNITFGSIDITFGDSASFDDGSVTFDVTASGGLAQGSTALYFVDKSYDNVGNFIWGDSGKYVTIYNAAGDKSSIFIDGGDTLTEVADKIEAAIVGDKSAGGLGMSSGDDIIDGHVADFVSTSTENTDEAVKGTIVIRSPKQGINGKLFISAPEDVLKFFSFANIQDPRDEIDPLTVTVYNAHNGDLIGSDTVSDNVLRNVIQGVDVYIDSNVDVAVTWNNATRSFDFASDAGSQTEYLHIVDASTTFQIGANSGQTTSNYIRQMDAKALGVNNVLVISQETAATAIGKLNDAIDMVSSERARIGGSVNRLEHTINNLNVQAENAIASESRIRDLDMAVEMTEFTKQQLLLQAGTAMLAQANQVPQILLQLLR